MSRLIAARLVSGAISLRRSIAGSSTKPAPTGSEAHLAAFAQASRQLVWIIDKTSKSSIAKQREMLARFASTRPNSRARAGCCPSRRRFDRGHCSRPLALSQSFSRSCAHRERPRSRATGNRKSQRTEKTSVSYAASLSTFCAERRMLRVRVEKALHELREGKCS